jgi:nickel transport protein
MTMTRRQAGMAAALLLGEAAGGCPPAAAHGTQHRVLGAHQTIVEFSYTDGQPMAFVEFQLFGAGDAQMPVRTGRTNRQGRVTFAPDTDGLWRIDVRDEEGHAVRAAVNASGSRPEAAGESLPYWLGAISLALNALLVPLILQHRLDRSAAKRPAGLQPPARPPAPPSVG